MFGAALALLETMSNETRSSLAKRAGTALRRPRTRASRNARVPRALRSIAWRLAGTAALVLTWGTGCGSSGHEGGGAPDSGTVGKLRVATYNAGLIDPVGYVPERLPLATKALADLDVDVLCVQEVWAEEHLDGLVAANQGKRPNVLRLEPRPGASGNCSPDEFLPLRSCAEAHCASAGPDSLVSCTTAECPDQVGVLSGTCISCLLDNAATGDFDAISTACLGTGNDADGGAVPPDERAYLEGGSFGIGLLSKLPFIETDKLELDASTNRRAILYAKVNVPSFGPLGLFCTHLGPIENDVKYEGSYGSWEAENAAHVKVLIDWVAEKQSAGGQVLVLGDLNTGPAGQAIAPSVPDNYALFPAAGFVDPFLSGPNAACTYCVENPLVIPTDAAADADIDHILTRGTTATATVQRLFTAPITITVQGPGAAGDGGAGDSGKTNTQREIRLSDHYGLEGTLVE